LTRKLFGVFVRFRAPLHLSRYSSYTALPPAVALPDSGSGAGGNMSRQGANDSVDKPIYELFSPANQG
jgi:hypothetical protein